MGDSLDFQRAIQQNRPILCVKFDGVIHEYNASWRLASSVILGKPVEGAFDFLAHARDHFCVCVIGERNAGPLSRRALFRWFKDHGWPVEDRRPANLLFPHRPPECFMLIDDRCLRFEGVFPDPLELTKFLSWKDSPP